MLGAGVFDQILGRGGATTFLTNWNDAREFVLNNIDNNPRIENERIALYEVEKNAYNNHYDILYSGTGLFDNTRPEDIYEYYLELNRNFPLYTNDIKFLNVFRSVVDASLAVNTDVSNLGDLTKPNRNLFIILGIATLLFIRR